MGWGGVRWDEVHTFSASMHAHTKMVAEFHMIPYRFRVLKNNWEGVGVRIKPTWLKNAMDEVVGCASINKKTTLRRILSSMLPVIMINKHTYTPLEYLNPFFYCKV